MTDGEKMIVQNEWWPYREVVVPITVTERQAESNDLYKCYAERVDAAYAAMNAALTEELYGDKPERVKPKPTWRGRMCDLRWRIRNAWLVLRGRADIC